MLTLTNFRPIIQTYRLWLLCVCVFSTVATSWAQPTQTLEDLGTLSAVRVGQNHYVAATDMAEMLERLHPDTQVSWDRENGIYTARVNGHEVRLYWYDNNGTLDGEPLDVRDPLIAHRERLHIAAPVLRALLEALEHGKRLDTAQPDQTPTPTDRQRLENPPLEALVSLHAEATREQVAIEKMQALLDRAPRPETRKPRVVLDPAPDPAAIAESNSVLSTFSPPLPDPPDITRMIAERCAEILRNSHGIACILTHENGDPAPSRSQRLRITGQIDNAALVALRIEASAFTASGGYRIFIPPMNTDAARVTAPVEIDRLHEAQAGNTLVLAYNIDRQLKGSGHYPAERRVFQAPHYLTKRSDMPALTLSLGNWTNQRDRALLQNRDQTEQTAQALAAGIADYLRWTFPMDQRYRQ